MIMFSGTNSKPRRKDLREMHHPSSNQWILYSSECGINCLSPSVDIQTFSFHINPFYSTLFCLAKNQWFSNLSPGSTKCLTKIDFSEALFCVNYDFISGLIWLMKSLNYKQPAFEQCINMERWLGSI